ncbi:hypothetical protein G5V58_02690 [Nocardioides anomalus]|uniref:C1q domain-containing protein n=1 Tax=Nocardioides anomalus TaxID=2712223 RepID=A0A6G6W904_9ACTN|nr:hypothetical protein [Nocardioides anomalus]QIG41831.1 hypothetical protein G5V58_02690 [Nocardioides anomalus]
MRAEGVATGCDTNASVISNAAGGVKLFWKRSSFDASAFLGAECATRSQLVVPRTGIYEITASLEWPSAAGSATRTLGTKRANLPYLAADRRANTPNEPTQQSIATVAYLNQGERIEVWAYPKSPGDLTLDPTLRTSTVTMHYVARS